MTEFDWLQVAVPWFLLRRRGHEVVFATERGAAPAADPLLISGVLCGQLGAGRLELEMYDDLCEDESFQRPIPWATINPEEFDGEYV